MLAAERRRAILEIVRSGSAASTEQMAQRFEVSHETVRRDLTSLEQAGLLSRVHGGAMAAHLPPVEPEFRARAGANEGAKAAIASLAIELLRPDQMIVIDVGTTALAVASAIPPAWRGTVLTTSLRVATLLVDRPGIAVQLSGGSLRADDLVLSGGHARAFFEQTFADVAFVSCGGVDADAGVTDYFQQEIDVRRAAMSNARQIWLLAEAAKVGKIAPFLTAPVNSLTGVITDASCPLESRSRLEQAGLQVLAPPSGPDGR